jgi:RNase P protein component
MHTIPQAFHETKFLKLDAEFTSIFQSKTCCVMAQFSYPLEKQTHRDANPSIKSFRIGIDAQIASVRTARLMARVRF